MTSTNHHGQPVGPHVPDWSPRPLPPRQVLSGGRVRLEPIAADHVPDLFAALATDRDEDLWTYRFDERPRDPDGLAGLVATWAARTPDVTFAIVPTAGPAAGTAAGMATLMRVDPVHGSVEIGSVMFGRSLQRTVAATEALHLLMAHVFDDLGYRRLEWKCDALNEPSRRAAYRLGFSYEGRFRQHLVVRGRARDTDWFSVVDGDWPLLRARLERWLDPANFDSAGRQRTALSDLAVGAAP